MLREVPEGWITTTLGEQIYEMRGGGTPSRKVAEYWGGDIPWASVKDLKGSYIDRTEESISKDGLLNCASNLIPRGTIVLATRMAVGKAVRFSTDVAINQDLRAIFPCAAVNVDFLHQWFIWREGNIRRLGSGTTVEGIRQEAIRALPIALPPPHEQRRIAEILSSVDEAIAATRAVIEQTRKVKQGVLERLLTKGIGHTRFKQTEIGEIPEGWGVAQLGQFARFQPGYAFKSAEFTDSGVRLLRGSNIGVGFFDWSEGITKYFPKERVDDFSEYLLRENDIIVAMDRPFISAGFKVARLKSADLPCLLLQRVGRLHPIANCDSDWLWQITSAGSVRVHLERQQAGTDLPHISRSDIESCMVALPPLTEQKAIAAMLQPFDIRLDLLAQSLSSKQRLKSALMSDLLTGRKRVTDALLMAAE